MPGQRRRAVRAVDPPIADGGPVESTPAAAEPADTAAVLERVRARTLVRQRDGRYAASRGPIVPKELEEYVPATIEATPTAVDHWDDRIWKRIG